MDRQPGRLARDVPQGDVDRPDGDRADEVAEIRHATPVPADVERVLADQQGLEERHDLVGDRDRPWPREAQDVVALDPLVGDDPQHCHRQAPVADPEDREIRRVAVVKNDPDISDPHVGGSVSPPTR